jgi:phage terminase small subunit
VGADLLKLNLFPSQRDPKAPEDLGRAGKRLWREVLAGFHIGREALPTLEIACRQLDVIDDARRRLRVDGMTVRGAKGGEIKHPCIGIERDASSLFLQALKELGIDRAPTRDTPGRPPGR